MHDVKRWIVVGQLFAAFAAQAEAMTVEEQPDPRTNAVMILLGGSGLVASPQGLSTSVAVAGEHRFGNVGVSLGVGAAASAVRGAFGSAALALTVEPGVRLYLAGARGVWLGAGLPLGYSSWSGPGFDVQTWSVGFSPALGFTHVFESGLVVQLNAGPSFDVGWSRSAQGGVGVGQLGGNGSTMSLGLHAGVGLGWAF